MRYTVFGGIGFVEDVPPGARRLGTISVEVGGAFEHAQLRTLDDVKRAMVAEVRARGGNAVVGFTYGQKSVGFWRSLIHLALTQHSRHQPQSSGRDFAKEPKGEGKRSERAV